MIYAPLRRVDEVAALLYRVNVVTRLVVPLSEEKEAAPLEVAAQAGAMRRHGAGIGPGLKPSALLLLVGDAFVRSEELIWCSCGAPDVAL